MTSASVKMPRTGVQPDERVAVAPSARASNRRHGVTAASRGTCDLAVVVSANALARVFPLQVSVNRVGVAEERWWIRNPMIECGSENSDPWEHYLSRRWHLRRRR